MSHVHHHSDESDPNSPYVVQLLFATPPVIGHEVWKQYVARQLGEAQTAETLEEGDRFVASLPGLISHLPEGDVAAQITLAQGDIFEPELVGEALGQTWNWPDAQQQVAEATSAVVVSDFLAGGLARNDRFRLINAMVNAVMAQATPLAIHWMPSQRIIEPSFYHQSLVHGASLADAAVNVRLYRISDGVEGETVMDTLGLAPFGLPDLQIHFSGLDPGELAPLLLSYAGYLFEKGDVLSDDAMIRGIEEKHEWVLARERALAPPLRDVVNIHPDEYAVKH